MTTTVRKIEYLSIIYKAIQLTEWSQSYTQYRVADSAVCDALNWALQYPAESGVASDLDDGEVVIVGQQFRFNSQPPEGGWRIQYFSIYNAAMFQLTAARRRLGARRTKSGARKSFQLTAARRRLVQPFDMSHNSAQSFQLTAARRRLVLHTRMCK